MTKTTEKVYYCDKHKEGVAKTGVAQNCPECGEAMKEIGWFEYAPGAEKK